MAQFNVSHHILICFSCLVLMQSDDLKDQALLNDLNGRYVAFPSRLLEMNPFLLSGMEWNITLLSAFCVS